MAIERRPRAMSPWSPFKEMEDWERRFEDLFERTFMPSLWRAPEDRLWMPAIDVFEKADKFVVKMELPGMKEEDIDVSVAGDSLVIRGEKKAETEVKDEDYYRCERTYGSFSRQVPLPSMVDTDKIEARYESGVLEVSLPKSAELKPKKIAVSAAKKPAK